MGGKKGRHSAAPNSKADFTLNDFANASTSVAKSGRVKKGEGKMITSNVKDLVAQKSEDLAWYEKDLSDFEITDEQSAAQLDVGNKENVGSVRSRTRRRRRKTEASDTETDESGGEVYPIDLWFLLGAYIHPEDISRFACICKGSHIVVHSAMFWHELYKRCYNSDVDLPMQLQPHCISRTHGLRTRVIRALFHMYPVFQERVKHISAFKHDPDVLIGSRCTLMWYKQMKAVWHFFFKFKRDVVQSRGNLSGQEEKEEDALLSEIDINHNVEHGSTVLQVIAPNFISLPVVMGQVLTKTFLSVSHDMRHHKLKLVFNHHYSPNDKNLVVNGTTVLIDPVLNLYVLPWWDPKYPYSNN